MLGMGFSDKQGNHNYGFEEMADLYTALFVQLHITQTHILAHDLGNSVVQELLKRNEERTKPFAINSIAFLNGGMFTDAYKPRFIQRLLSDSPKPIEKFVSSYYQKQVLAKLQHLFLAQIQSPQKNYWKTFGKY